ncbi:lipoprotein required for motility [Sulfurospirillum sp. T05]|uniref:Lipoprotein required for motility n=1 Tax=Sulfurospirillum tamanense TaxID=2813362 RepID=A0ABS2WPP7_9BACT|nr:lipoprotein required for motility [Sulfurospirillum tamanensis]
MNKLALSLVASLSLLMLFSGCVPQQQPQVVTETERQVVIQKVDKEDIREVMREEKLLFINNAPDKVFAVMGEGIAPQNTISPAQAMALAKRAALADAYRQMGAKLYGVRISAKDTVQDAALKDSRIVAQVDGLIKDASITDMAFQDGLYRVTMELKMSEERWKEIFSY